MLTYFIMFMLFSIGFSMGLFAGLAVTDWKRTRPYKYDLDNDQYYSEDE